MGKEGELWDDSVLVKAFDDAMSNYKKMHSKKKKANDNDNSIDEDKEVTNSGQVNGSAPFNDNQNHQPISTREVEDTNNTVSNTNTEMREAKDLTPVKEDACVDSYVPKPYIDSSNGLATQDALKGYSSSQGAGDYNQLLCQCYELEEKRQRILQQLHQYSSWNYQYSGEVSNSGAQWGSCSTSQEYSVPASQAPNRTAVCSCCPYGSQFLVAPCMTYPSCSLGRACTGKTCTDTYEAASSQKSPSLVNTDIVKTAMGAVEKAISSMKTKIPFKTDRIEEVEKNKGNEAETQSISSETDLTVVLNAWYSAGFYTGKYLTEQSMAKNRHR